MGKVEGGVTRKPRCRRRASRTGVCPPLTTPQAQIYPLRANVARYSIDARGAGTFGGRRRGPPRGVSRLSTRTMPPASEPGPRDEPASISPCSNGASWMPSTRRRSIRARLFFRKCSGIRYR
jgi:hypothetical protein